MFRLQKELLDGYIKIESLPAYPVDLNTKESQILLKDFNARITEELGEAMESYLIILNDPDIQYTPELAKPHISNFNEELADAMHFYLELLVYSGIKAKDLLPSIGETNHTSDLDLCLKRLKQEFPPVQNLLQNNPRIPHLEDSEKEGDSLLSGGTVWNQGVSISMKVILWDITYYLQMARNTLKNKPWKQTGMLTDERAYQRFLKIGFIKFLSLFVYLGVNDLEIFEVYAKKNAINKFRQQSKY